MTYTLPALPAPAAVDIAEKSSETMNWLRANIKVGYTDERGPAWWANGAVTKAGTWTSIPDGSHFAGPVPIDAVHDQLDIRLVKATAVYAEYEDENSQRQVATDPGTLPIINQRTGQIFGYPKEGYKIHPYLKTLHGFIEDILHDEHVGVGSVGLLRKGGVAFLQARLPETFEVAGYGYQPYVTAVTSADQSRGTTYTTGALGAVCDNTVDAALAGALTKFKIKHSRNSELRVQRAREALGIQLVQVAETIGDTIDKLANVPVSNAELEAWLDLTVPLTDEKGQPKEKRGLTVALNKRERLEVLRRDPKVAPWDGTAFGVLQLDNTDRTWNATVRGSNRMERNLSNDVFGVTSAADAQALEALAEVKGRTLTFA